MGAERVIGLGVAWRASAAGMLRTWNTKVVMTGPLPVVETTFPAPFVPAGGMRKGETGN